MSMLQVELFGSVRLSHNEWITEVLLTGENQGLLAFLLIQRHRIHSRDVLAEMFWGEYSQERARGSLNTALWKLKRALEPKGIPSGTYLKNTHLGGVGFNRESQYWLDIQVFEQEINRILNRPFQSVEETHLADLEKVLGLYKGDLLEGYYKDWALRERERLRTLYLKSLTYLLHYYEIHRVYEKAIEYAQQILGLDPLREEIHRELMKLYLENGQRALAVRQYEVCRTTLAKELNIFPMEDTQALYHQIANGNELIPAASLSKQQTNMEQALRQLREASQTVDRAKDQIQQALKMIARIKEPMD